MLTQNYTDITQLVKRVQRNKNILMFIEHIMKWSLVASNLGLFYLFINYYHNQNTLNQEVTKILYSQKSQVLSVTTSVIPIHLIIPQIAVNTDIEQVGVTPEGAMAVPKSAQNVGWYMYGVRPGEKGSAVIAGHVDDDNGSAGIFTNLNKLKKGDKIFVKNDKGSYIAFVVRESRIYDPGYADDVFNSGDMAHLNLITCDGVWEGDKKSYSKRLVVFSDLIPDYF